MGCSVKVRRDFVIELESSPIVHPSQRFAALRNKKEWMS